MTEPAPGPGVKINLVSRDFLDKMPTAEKIRFILDEVVAGKVLVLERGLTATEEAKLIEATMSEIDPDHFIGIEMQSYQPETQPDTRWRKLLSKGRLTRPRTVVVGPASLLKTVRRDSQTIQALILAPAGPEA